MKKKNRILFSALSIFALITLILIPLGCGGGGDGGGDGDGDSTTVDTTPPTVVSVSPSADGSDIATNTNISVTFSEAMDPSTINENTITMSSSAGTLSADGPSSRNVAGTVSYANMIATFTPSAGLAFATTFTVTVTTGVTDLAGNALTAAYVFMFSTGLEPDLTAPTVTGTTPDDGGSEIELDTVVSATFSEPVDPATLTVDTIEVRLRGYNVMDFIPGLFDEFELDSAGTVLSFQPPDGLARSAEYEVVLGTGITDMAGNGLASEFSWAFTTRPGAWGDPEVLYTGSSDYPRYPQVGFDGPGTAHLLWSGDGEGGGYAYNTFSRRYRSSGNPVWGSRQTRNESVSDGPYHARPWIASNRVGTTAAIWNRNTYTETHELFGDLFTDGAWEGNEQISDYNETDYPDSQSIAIDMFGNAFAVWYSYISPSTDSYDEGYYVFARRHDTENGSVLEDTEAVASMNPGDGWLALTSTACDAGGNAVVAWFQETGDGYIATRRYAYGDGWSSTQKRVSSPDCTDVWNPGVGMDARGNAIVVWSGLIDENSRICANRFDVDDGWGSWDSTSQAIISDDTESPEDVDPPSIAVDLASGDAVVVWREYRASPVLAANLYRAGSDEWKTPIVIADNTDIDPQVACDFAGNFFILWQDDTSMYTRTYRLGDAWNASSFSDPLEVGTRGETERVHLGAGPNGRVIAAWEDIWDIEAVVFE